MAYLHGLFFAASILVGTAVLPCHANSRTTQPAAGGKSASTNPGDIVPRKPHAAPVPGTVTDLDIKELGNFDYDIDKGGNIPIDVKQLNGTPFRTRGFMIPMDQADSITEFVLVPSLFICCLNGPPQIQHPIVVHCPKGKAISYFPDQIVVEGTLKVEENKDEGYIISIFEIDAKSVKPAPK